jgi:N-acetylmuramoyl-L-alanine amidase
VDCPDFDANLVSLGQISPLQILWAILLKPLGERFCSSEKISLKARPMRCSFFRLRAFVAFPLLFSGIGASLSHAAEPSHGAPAQFVPISTPLGGPVVPLGNPTISANAAKPAPPGEVKSGAPASGTPFYPGVTYSDASDKATVAGQPPAALGLAPYDLNLIKKLKVGTQMLPEVPLRVGNLDILAPFVDQMSTLGATVTRADPRNVPGAVNQPSEAQHFQVNLAQGPPIVLTIGKSSAWIGNQEQPLRAAPLVIGNQIYLPVFSLAPLLGAAARLDDTGTLVLTPTIQSVELFPIKNTIAVTIKASAPLSPGLAKIVTVKATPGASAKVYVDFPGYSMGFDAGNSSFERLVAPGVGDVLRARAGMPSKFPDTTRIVLDLKRPLEGLSQLVPDPTLFALVLAPRGQRVAEVPDVIFTDPEPTTTIKNEDPRVGLRSSGSLRGMTIVVDAGHGGKDTGARGIHSNEKAHALDISRRLRNHLQARGASVLMTRDSDNFISLQGRVDFANQRRADLFVSVHINASVNKNVTGTQTFYYTAISQSLAREVHKELVKATGRTNRGITQARFYVVRKTWMPSILTETAFISNGREESLLRDQNFRERVARGIAQGVSNYVSIYGRAGLEG